jgi:biotin carboxyl carrier protein
MTYDVTIEGKNYRLELNHSEGRWECRLDGRAIEIDAVLARRDVLSILMNGKAYEVKRERAPTDMHLWVGSSRYAAQVRDPRSLRGRASLDDGRGPRKLIAPMPGKIVRVLVKENAEVDAGQGLLVVEAMKMQNEIKSPKKGVVRKMVAAEGASVSAGDVLAVVE